MMLPDSVRRVIAEFSEALTLKAYFPTLLPPIKGKGDVIMLKDVYTVYDKKTASYGNLILATHVGEITRSIERAIADPESALSKWPGEFQVVTIGQYDQSSGKLIPKAVEVVIEVAALVRPQSPVKGGA